MTQSNIQNSARATEPILPPAKAAHSQCGRGDCCLTRLKRSKVKEVSAYDLSRVCTANFRSWLLQ